MAPISPKHLLAWPISENDLDTPQQVESWRVDSTTSHGIHLLGSVWPRTPPAAKGRPSFTTPQHTRYSFSSEIKAKNNKSVVILCAASAARDTMTNRWSRIFILITWPGDGDIFCQVVRVEENRIVPFVTWSVSGGPIKKREQVEEVAKSMEFSIQHGIWIQVLQRGSTTRLWHVHVTLSPPLASLVKTEIPEKSHYAHLFYAPILREGGERVELATILSHPNSDTPPNDVASSVVPRGLFECVDDYEGLVSSIQQSRAVWRNCLSSWPVFPLPDTDSVPSEISVSSWHEIPSCYIDMVVVMYSYENLGQEGQRYYCVGTRFSQLLLFTQCQLVACCSLPSVPSCISVVFLDGAESAVIMVQGGEWCSWWESPTLKEIYSRQAELSLACDWEGTGSDQVLLWDASEDAPSPLISSLNDLKDRMEEEDHQPSHRAISEAPLLLGSCLEDRVREGEDEWQALLMEKREKERLLQQALRHLQEGTTMNSTDTERQFFDDRSMITLSEGVEMSSQERPLSLRDRVRTETAELLQISSGRWVIGLVLSQHGDGTEELQLAGFDGALHLPDDCNVFPPPCTIRGPTELWLPTGASVGVCVVVEGDWSVLMNIVNPVLSLSCQVQTELKGQRAHITLAQIVLTEEKLLGYFQGHIDRKHLYLPEQVNVLLVSKTDDSKWLRQECISRIASSFGCSRHHEDMEHLIVPLHPEGLRFTVAECSDTSILHVKIRALSSLALQQAVMLLRRAVHSDTILLPNYGDPEHLRNIEEYMQNISVEHKQNQADGKGEILVPSSQEASSQSTNIDDTLIALRMAWENRREKNLRHIQRERSAQRVLESSYCATCHKLCVI